MHVRRVVAFVILSDDVIMITGTHRCTVWRYALLLLVPVILFGCDAADPLTSQVSPVDIDSTSALKVHPLSFTEILRTHPDVLPTWEDRADQGDDDARTPAEMGDVHLRAPYVCVISSPNLTGKGGPDARYRYDGVVLDFAPAVLATARSMSSGGGVPTRMIEVKTGAHVNPRHTEAQVLRWARCRVPDVPGVEDMVTERLGYADYQPGRVGNGARDSRARERDVGKRTAQDLRKWEGVPVEDRTFAALVRPPRKTSCYTEYVCTRSCSTCSLENCVSKGVTCHGFGGGTSGSGGSGTGYDDGGYPGTGPIPTIYPDDREIVLVPVNPCERDDPPDYCDQAGSCYDKSIGNATHEQMLEAMEDQGALNELWNDSNADQSQSERKEQGGFLVPNGYDDGYTFQRLQPSQITQQNEYSLRFTFPAGGLPSGAVYVHTHPYANTERMRTVPGPSRRYGNWVGKEDRRALRRMNVSEGIIVDGDKIIFYRASGSGSSGYADYGRCGY